MAQPRTLIFRTAGTNCDQELAQSFKMAESTVDVIHLSDILDNPEIIKEYQLIGFPGGFSYGDDIAAGRIYANILRHRLLKPLQEAIAGGTCVIGICNGFQVLVKLGLLPYPADAQPVATLTDNDTGRFKCCWEPCQAVQDSVCVWTKGMRDLDLPMAHGEGRFLASEEVLADLNANGQVALRYVNDPNGSSEQIAGICDPTGRVLGLMPHPERYTHLTHHPSWARQPKQDVLPGLQFFINAVSAVAHSTSIK